MQTKLSVITCSHNPRKDYLIQVIEALKNQSLAKQSWEYLLIDNASDEPLAQRVDLSWQPNARHVREEKLGLTHARLRGIREAQGDLLVFVDDDNVLDAEFLEVALKIANEWPRLGVWGGQTLPTFEAEPAEWTKEFWGRLVIREFGSARWSNQPSDAEAMPCGAGMCVRREVANHYLKLHDTGKRKILMDRTGSSLVSGGDTDLAMCACDLGVGMGLFPDLELRHLIPAVRLTEDYLVRLVEGLAFSAVVLNSFRTTNGNGKTKLSTSLADIGRLLIRNRRQRRFFRAVRNGENKARKLLEVQTS
jgi:glycosyltransferase involved in cell wall biosynthesis